MGRPFMGNMVVEDAAGQKTPEFAAALREQQRIDLERSLEFAKTAARCRRPVEACVIPLAGFGKFLHEIAYPKEKGSAPVRESWRARKAANLTCRRSALCLRNAGALKNEVVVVIDAASPDFSPRWNTLWKPPEGRGLTGCGKTIPSCHPEQQRRISLCSVFKTMRDSSSPAAPQNDSASGFFRSLFRPPFGEVIVRVLLIDHGLKVGRHQLGQGLLRLIFQFEAIHRKQDTTGVAGEEGPRRGPMSLAVGEIHGTDALRRVTNPEGIKFGLAPSWFRKGSTPSGSIGIWGSLSSGFTHG